MSQTVRSRSANSPAGFTLIELLIVVTIIGILAGIAIPGLINALDKSKQVSSAASLRAFGESLEVYSSDAGLYPAVANARELMPILHPYSQTLDPNDAWKHPIAFETDGDTYSLECYGKDGIDGENVTPQTRYIFTLDLLYSLGGFVNGIE